MLPTAQANHDGNLHMWVQVASPTLSNLDAVDEPSIVGDDGTILVFNGLTGLWTSDASPTSVDLNDVSGNHAVGASGTFLERVGGSWITTKTGGSQIGNSVDGDYAVGNFINDGLFFEKVGGTWGTVVPATPGPAMRGVSGNYAVGGSGSNGVVYERLNGTWTQVFSTSSGALLDVDGNYAVGTNGVILERVGGSWTEVESPVNQDLHGVGGNYAVGNSGTIVERINGFWTEVESPTIINLRGVGGDWAVGQNGVILQRQSQPLPGSDPLPTTGPNQVSCPDQATVNGIWSRGTGQVENTFGRFAWVAGQTLDVFLPDEDLRDNPGVQFTTLTDLGSGSFGQHNATVSYDNLAGTSYQFMARAGTDGEEQLGDVVFIPNGQCTLSAPSTTGYMLAIDNFRLSISQAQCMGDPTSFAIAHEHGGAGSSNVTVYIYNEQGQLLSATNEADMAVDPSARRYFVFEELVAPGSYMGLALHEGIGIGSNDWFDVKAFNVPLNPCIGITEQQRADIKADLLDVLDDINFTNIELDQHREDSLEVMGMDFNGIGFDGTIFFLFWIAILILGLVRGWVLPSLFATWGAINEAYLQVFPFSATVLFFVLALWLEAIARKKIFKEQVRADVDA